MQVHSPCGRFARTWKLDAWVASGCQVLRPSGVPQGWFQFQSTEWVHVVVALVDWLGKLHRSYSGHRWRTIFNLLNSLLHVLCLLRALVPFWLFVVGGCPELVLLEQLAEAGWAEVPVRKGPHEPGHARQFACRQDRTNVPYLQCLLQFDILVGRGLQAL